MKLFPKDLNSGLYSSYPTSTDICEVTIASRSAMVL